ncbi:unnamed protein product, partial [Mesorhabditis belari]|uniref:Uncharacterized protein n=1 Tax=Mesorhabditis belari TaxID=2138241 RepID=A0AAF3J4D6_9BILA
MSKRGISRVFCHKTILSEKLFKLRNYLKRLTMNTGKVLSNADLAQAENCVEAMNLMVPGPLIGSSSKLLEVDLIRDSTDLKDSDRATHRASPSIATYPSSHPDDENGEDNRDDENSSNSTSGSSSPATADTTFGIVSLLEVDSTVDGTPILRDDEVAFISSAAAFVSRERPFKRCVKKADCRMLRRLGWGVRGVAKWQNAWNEYRRRHPYHQILVEEDREQSNYLTRTTSAIKENLTEVFVGAITSLTRGVSKLGF